jgi:hypothetical protein
MQIIPLRIRTNEDDQLDMRHLREELWVPGWCEITPRRQVAVRAFAWVIKIHRDERKQIRIVKLFFGHAEPRAE